MRPQARARHAVAAIALAAIAVVGAALPAGTEEGERMTRTFEMRRLGLEEGEAVAFGFHPTSSPITMTASVAGLEVCPAELADIYEGRQRVASYWFDCRSLDADHEIALPPAPVDHIGILVRARRSDHVRIGRLAITYEPGDGFFYLAPPPLDPGERTAPLVVTPMSSEVVAADAGFSHFTTRVTQRGERIGLVDLPDEVRGDAGYGPVRLDVPVVVRVKNTSDQRQPVGVAVSWE